MVHHSITADKETDKHSDHDLTLVWIIAKVLYIPWSYLNPSQISVAALGLNAHEGFRGDPPETHLSLHKIIFGCPRMKALLQAHRSAPQEPYAPKSLLSRYEDLFPLLPPICESGEIPKGNIHHSGFGLFTYSGGI
jgi:hypothetical protein